MHDDETARPSTNVVNTEFRNDPEWKKIQDMSHFMKGRIFGGLNDIGYCRRVVDNLFWFQFQYDLNLKHSNSEIFQKFSRQI